MNESRFPFDSQTGRKSLHPTPNEKGKRSSFQGTHTDTPCFSAVFSSRVFGAKTTLGMAGIKNALEWQPDGKELKTAKSFPFAIETVWKTKQAAADTQFGVASEQAKKS